jgi:hypothetical protein
LEYDPALGSASISSGGADPRLGCTILGTDVFAQPATIKIQGGISSLSHLLGFIGISIRFLQFSTQGMFALHGLVKDGSSLKLCLGIAGLVAHGVLVLAIEPGADEQCQDCSTTS